MAPVTNTFTTKKFSHLIDGKLVPGDATFDVVNPSTGAPFAKAPHASKAQAEAAVAAARKAFESWSETPHEERVKCLKKAAAAIAANADEIGKLLTLEQGKPFPIAKGETLGTTELIEHAAAYKIPVDVYTDNDKLRIEAHHVPVGVIACICPWNYPLWCSVNKWSAALAYGNTCVVKPSPFTPLATLLMAETVKDCFPAGVLNFIAGDDKSDFNVGAFLSNNQQVDKVSFTGSVATGKKIMECCIKDVKRTVLEMGGNDPAIVRSDVDIKKAAQGVFDGAFKNTGQICCAIKRCFVHKSIFEEFKAEIVKCAENAVVGDGFTEGVEYGPLNNKMQYDKVCAFAEDCKKVGAEILCGGRPMKPEEIKGGEASSNGYFFKPTIVAGVKEGNRIVDEEQFGPILPIMPYETDEEAVKRANNCEYGLGGSVWSSNLSEANKIARKIKSGTVWVNTHTDFTWAPFGGFRQSGIGREYGKSDLTAFTETQTIQFAK